MKQRKKREKYIRDASKKVKEIKENVMNFTGIMASELEGMQPKAHISLIGTSSDSEIPVELKRVERKRKPSPVPSPSPKRTRTLRKKQQAVREMVKKLTPKKKQKPITPSLNDLLNEITDDGNLANVSKLYN